MTKFKFFDAIMPLLTLGIPVLGIFRTMIADLAAFADWTCSASMTQLGFVTLQQAENADLLASGIVSALHDNSQAANDHTLALAQSIANAPSKGVGNSTRLLRPPHIGVDSSFSQASRT